MPVSIIEISQAERDKVLALRESHFCDFKSILIKPAKLTRTIAALSNAEGGEVYIRERQVDSGHPAFDGCLHSVRHLLGNHLNQVAVNHCSRHRFTSFLK